MIIKLILAIALIFILWSGIHQFKRLPPNKKKQAVFKAVLFAVAAAILLGVITGRMHWLGAVFAALIPLFRFGSIAAFKLLPFWLNRGGIIPLKTPYIDAKIELKTGKITGTILQGEHKGKDLASLNTQELEGLLQELNEKDAKAYYVIKLLRNKTAQQEAPPSNFTQQDYQEALQTLGLTGTPTRKDVINAHRRLINKLHPDRGGSDFLAARVNQARDELLKHIKD